MSDQLARRAAELIAQGYYVAPAKGYKLLTPDIDPRKTPYTPAEAERGPDLNICLGLMRSGRYAYKLDLDSHTDEQNADAARTGLKQARPELESKIDWHRSSSQKGWHGHFISTKRLATGKLYDAAGKHIGELLGADTDRTLDPGTLNPPTLHSGEVERLFNVWYVKASDPKGEQWKDRARQGEIWARGYQYIPVTRQQLRAFLQNDAGKVGRQLDSYFDQPPRNRSDAAGSLMQNIMFFARRLPGCANASFHTRCANVMAYWMAAKSYGKADDKEYNQEKDGWSLIAQIVNGDPYGDGKRWACPSWVDSTTTTTAPAPQPAPATPRAAHRPAGDRTKHLAAFRRIVEAIVPDDFGRRTYTLEHLADKMKSARCKVGTRTIQSYLHELREKNEIVTAQIGGNGMPYAFLKPCFGGAIKSQKRVEIAPESPVDWGADHAVEQRILTPQSVEITAPCKEDHQDTCVPPLLADLAAEYLARPASDIGERLVNATTGVIMYRRTAKHFAGLIVATYPIYTADEARAAYKAEQQRLVQLERAMWQRFFTWLRKLSDQELITYIAGRARASLLGVVDHTEEQEVQVNTFDKHLYITRLRCAKQQLARRGLTMPAKATTQKPVTPRRQQPQGGAQGAGDPLPRPQARPTAPALLQPDLFADASPPPTGTLASLLSGIHAYHTQREQARI